jgi:hypothetical protein
MICPTGRAKYFYADGWTVESALIGLTKFDLWRHVPGSTYGRQLCFAASELIELVVEVIVFRRRRRLELRSQPFADFVANGATMRMVDGVVVHDETVSPLNKTRPLPLAICASASF